MQLTHLLLSSVSVECTSCESFLRLFRNYVYYHFIFPKINKRGDGIRAGARWKFFYKLISGGGDDYSVLESTDLSNVRNSDRNSNATRRVLRI